MSGNTHAEAPAHVGENIDAMVRLEQQALQRRTAADRVSDAIAGFAGTILFVGLHIAWFSLWVLINVGLLPIIRPFDPYPFALLAMIVSIEGVLLSAFVLIKQNRAGYLADRRAHIDLQVNLLTEREVTRLLRLTVGIAERLGVEDVERLDHAMAQSTELESLVGQLDERLGGDSA